MHAKYFPQDETENRSNTMPNAEQAKPLRPALRAS